MSENSRLQKLCSQRGVHDIESLQKQAQQVLQENRTLIKEQQMVGYLLGLCIIKTLETTPF